jgi:methyl-accepting chemotaxis protein
VASLTAQADFVESEIKAGMDRSHQARSSFTVINQAVFDVSELVALVDCQTADIAASTIRVRDSVDRVKDGLGVFASDARENGGQLHEAQRRVTDLELQSNYMLNRLANCGIPIADTPMIEDSRLAAGEIVKDIEKGISEGRITEDDVFDHDYVPMPGTDPVQYSTRFSDFADAHIRAALDRFHQAHSPFSLACVVSDVNGYLPTHMSERSLPQGDDPVWNHQNCRNRRIFMDDLMRRVVENEVDPLLFTIRTDIDMTSLKSVSVPMYVAGRRWGNFEFIYRDEKDADEPG